MAFLFFRGKPPKQDLIGPLPLGSKPLVAGHSAWHLWCSLWSHRCGAYHRFCHDAWRANILLLGLVLLHEVARGTIPFFWEPHWMPESCLIMLIMACFSIRKQQWPITWCFTSWPMSGPGLRVRPPWRLAFWSQPSAFLGFVFRPWSPTSSHTTAGGVVDACVRGSGGLHIWLVVWNIFYFPIYWK